MELEERRLTLWQARVASGLQSEAEGRAAARVEVARLMAKLQELDWQLDVSISADEARGGRRGE